MAVATTARAVDAVHANPNWYHRIEVAPGVVTPGVVELRPAAEKVFAEVPLQGARALDVGTFDGFWAFEMERRGAAEVVAIDKDGPDPMQWPLVKREMLRQRWASNPTVHGRGFEIAKELLGSKAERVLCNVFDLTPEAIGGPVDVAFAGAIQLHMRDQVGMLERVYGALKPGGMFVAYEPFSVIDTLRAPRRPMARLQTLETLFNWWTPNLRGLYALARSAGFVDIRRATVSRPSSKREMKSWHVGYTARRPA